MEWARYKALCDTGNAMSRWLLEQTRELLAGEGEAGLAGTLDKVMSGDPLPKPRDHKGGPATDMFVMTLADAEIRLVLRAVSSAAGERRTTAATRERGLGGFVEAWTEYLRWKQRGAPEMDSASVVMSLIEAFNANDMERIIGHFTDDAVYHNIPTDPVTGPSAIREVLQGFLGMSSEVDWQVKNLVADEAGVVLTERVDRFHINGKWLELPVMGAFEVTGEKICAWRDYFDMNQFTSQLG